MQTLLNEATAAYSPANMSDFFIPELVIPAAIACDPASRTLVESALHDLDLGISASPARDADDANEDEDDFDEDEDEDDEEDEDDLDEDEDELEEDEEEDLEDEDDLDEEFDEEEEEEEE